MTERTIFDSLRDDHDAQRTLVDILTNTSGASEGRAEIFPKLAEAMRFHAAAEERYFYVPLMELDSTQDNARHSVAEHKELDDLLEELESMDHSSSAWLPKAKELAERLVHHLDEEETEVFPVAGRVLSDEKKQALAAEYDADMERRKD